MDPQAPIPDTPAAAQRAFWNERGAAVWTRFQDRIDAAVAPITAVALEAAAARPGESVLDIGSGCGETILELARAVGPEGRVRGIDISAPMSEEAARRIAAAALANAEAVVADAATHRFEPAAADLLFSRFGVMFFEDPVAALGHLRGAMRPTGRLAWAVWREVADNPWFTVPLKAAAALLPPAAPPDPYAPGPLAFADSDRVAGLLTAAGWRNARFARHDLPLRIGAADNIEAAVEMMTSIGPLARRMADLGADEALRSAVDRAVAEALRQHVEDGAIVLGSSVWIVTAEA